MSYKFCGHWIGSLLRTGAVVFLSAIPFTPAAAHGVRVLYVANYGVDSSVCGDRTSRCRSITQAVQNAVDGDLIEVGPGIYGDIDDDGFLQSPGDENRFRDGEGHVVFINKRVDVYSRAGAASTLIRRPRDGSQGITVEITGHGATFGHPNGGFTIFTTPGRSGNGIFVKGANVRISGNAVMNHNDIGIVFDLSSFDRSGRGTATDNVSLGNRVGFTISGVADRSRFAVVVRNIALKNREVGFEVHGAGPHVVSHNEASDNETGFSLDGGPYTFRKNIAVANTRDGVLTSRSNSVWANSPGSLLADNTVAGNGNSGFRFTDPVGTNRLRRNNIYGNGGHPFSGASNCGIKNESGFAVSAIENFWGAPSGPGDDPADNARGACDAGAGQTMVVPFATERFPLN
jgi:parallel beta-helix repeat protein